MRVGINAGFGDPIAHELAGLSGLGCRVLRQSLLSENVPGKPHLGIRPGDDGPRDPVATRRLVDEIEAFDRQAFDVYWGATLRTIMDAPIGCNATLLNEPNHHGWSAQQYAEYCSRALDVAEARGIFLWCGSIANLSTVDLLWLEDVLSIEPRIPGVEVHWYPREQDQKPETPKPNHRSIARQFARLRDVCDGRPWICGEFGIHQAPMTRGMWWWKTRYRLTEREQADRILWMASTLAREGCADAMVYQLNDGQTDDPEGRRGIRTADGRWKVAAMEVFRDA